MNYDHELSKWKKHLEEVRIALESFDKGPVERKSLEKEHAKVKKIVHLILTLRTLRKIGGKFL